MCSRFLEFHGPLLKFAVLVMLLFAFILGRLFLSAVKKLAFCVGQFDRIELSRNTHMIYMKHSIAALCINTGRIDSRETVCFILKNLSNEEI